MGLFLDDNTECPHLRALFKNLILLVTEFYVVSDAQTLPNLRCPGRLMSLVLGIYRAPVKNQDLRPDFRC